MDTNTISLLLWVPFLLIWLPATLIYCIKGLRKGFQPALISLSAIIVSALVNMFLARVLAGVVTPILKNAIPADFFSGSYTAELLLGSIIGSLAAMLLFMLLFLILTPIMAGIGKWILRKKLAAEEVTDGSKVGGIMVGMVNAVLFTMVFLIPIYGTLAAYAPVARSALDMIPAASDSAQSAYTPQPMSASTRQLHQETSAPDSDLQLLRDILDCILQHPLVELSATAPVQTMYVSLSQVSVEQTPVNLSDMAGAVKELMNKIQAIAQADDGQRTDALRELIAFCREDILTQEWAYTVYIIALEKGSALLEDVPAADEILDILTFDDEEFRRHTNLLLDFAEATLEHDILARLEQGDPTVLTEEALLKEGIRFLNATEQMAALKNILFRTALEAAVEGNAEQIRAFTEKYPLEMLTDPAQQEQEAQAFHRLLDTKNADPMGFFMQHPSLGQDALRELAVMMGITI